MRYLTAMWFVFWLKSAEPVPMCESVKLRRIDDGNKACVITHLFIETADKKQYSTAQTRYVKLHRIKCKTFHCICNYS